MSELAFLAVVHKDQFASKWQTALTPHFGICLKEGLPTPFAFFYVYYNALSRRDIGQKTRAYNEAVAKKLVKLELESKNEVHRGLLFRMKRKWIHFTVAIEQKFLSMCNPLTVLSVADSEEIKFFRSINQIESQILDINKMRDDCKPLTFVSRISIFLRRCLSLKDESERSVHSNGFGVPSDALSQLQRFRKNLSRSFSDSFLDTLLALLIFDHAKQWQYDSSSALFASKLHISLCSFRTACRAIACFDIELEKLTTPLQNPKKTILQSLHRLFLTSDARVFDMFSTSSVENVHKILHSCGFPNVQDGDLHIAPIQKLVDITVQSLDIEGGFSADNDHKKSINHIHQPKHEMLVSRPKMISSALHRLRNGSLKSSQRPVSFQMVLVDACVQQSCTTPSGNDEGLLQGYHEVSVASGDRYVGNFHNGLRSGQGKYLWQSGDVYSGLWCDDERHGFGILICQRGNKYEGEWLQGRRSGWGQMNFDDGSLFQGQWWNDQFSGKGVYTFRDGRYLQGEWVGGKLVDEYEVDVSYASKLRFTNAVGNVYQFNSDANPTAMDNQNSAMKVRESSSFLNLLFGRDTQCHTSELSNGVHSNHGIEYEAKHDSQRSFLFINDASHPSVEVGHRMFSQVYDAFQKNMSEASYMTHNERVQVDTLISFEKEIALLENRNQSLKIQLRQLQNDAQDYLIHQTFDIDFDAEPCLQIDLPDQETLILDLAEQIRITSAENDEIVTELSLEQFKYGTNGESEISFMNLLHQEKTLSADISLKKLELERLTKENAELKVSSRFIDEQNRSFESAIRFQSDFTVLSPPPHVVTSPP